MSRRAGTWAWKGTLGLALALVLAPASSPRSSGAAFAIAGPDAVAVGGSIELVATGAGGGTVRWLVDPESPVRGSRRAVLANPRVRLVPRGQRLRVDGLVASARARDVEVVAYLSQSGVTATARKRLTVVEGDATAYRPQHGSGYAPFARTAVADADEADPQLGPGIRVNAPGDVDPQGEDDLIELELQAAPPGAAFVLRRSGGALAVWTTRDRTPGTELPFAGNETAPLPLDSGGRLRVWVEWAASGHGLEALALAPPGGSALDRVRFHSFQSIVMALGGEDQVPSNPVDPNHGTYVVAIPLYEAGWDAHLFDEDDVANNGSGPVFNEVVTAVRDRSVEQVVSFGYSHGGGSTYDLIERLDLNRGSIGVFSVPFTSYVDGIENDSDLDTQPELRIPPTSAYHVNQYQRGTLADFFLDGGPIPGSIPPPTGLDVETTPWGVGATHFIVDDYSQVKDLIETSLAQRVNR